MKPNEEFPEPEPRLERVKRKKKKKEILPFPGLLPDPCPSFSLVVMGAGFVGIFIFLYIISKVMTYYS